MESAGSLFILLLLALPILLIVFQRRTMKRQLQQVQSQLQLGAEVMTHSGVYGTVRALREDYVELEVAPGVVMRWARAAIGRVITPTEATEDAVEPGPFVDRGYPTSPAPGADDRADNLGDIPPTTSTDKPNQP